MIKQLAEMSGLNAYIVWYYEENKRVYKLQYAKYHQAIQIYKTVVGSSG